jgi:AraC family transcriptional regulator, regulatory protein of adaptative response / methylated-DNA-[protein]-cysteine methyltransferase
VGFESKSQSAQSLAASQHGDVIGSDPTPKTMTPDGCFASEAERWAAVAARNGSADGIFWYSVSTTGVYCRPSCGARQARREHVRFHSTREDAERAGFRPCRRCRPDLPRLAERRALAIADACQRIAEAEEAPSLETLAAAAGMSRFHFQRVFKALTGVTPKAFAAGLRNARARRELGRDGTVTDAIYEAGFNSSGHFYGCSSAILGMTPTEFRSGGTGVAIRFAVGECSLGSILVAATDRGVCSIMLGDDPDRLVQELQDRFPQADLIGSDRDFEQLVAGVIGLVEAPGSSLDLPLDIRGTAFQQRVWQALGEIPPGSTASYAEIASRVGSPKAARAVGRACASNPVAVAIPCHRVVGKHGDLTGYRWGAERKRALLDREAKSERNRAGEPKPPLQPKLLPEK